MAQKESGNNCGVAAVRKNWFADAVVSVAVAALLLVAAEGAARWLVPPPERGFYGVDKPLLDTEAYEDYPHKAEMAADRGYREYLSYEPFVMWRHTPYQGRHMVFDEDGFRRTVDPGKAGCTGERTVMMLGGSTIGTGLFRDEDTIPSLLSQRLNALLPDVCVRVLNRGQTGYNNDNETVLLYRRLAAGERPDLVVFYDGANDLMHKVVHGVPHMRYDLFKGITNSPLANLVLHLRLVQLLTGARPDDPVSDAAEAEERSAATARSIAGNAAVAAATGEALGFKVVMALQPVIFTKQSLSAEERSVLAKVERAEPLFDQAAERFYDAVRRRLSEPGAAWRFIDLSDALDGAPSVFVDPMHISPRGNALAADFLAAAILEEGLLP